MRFLRGRLKYKLKQVYRNKEFVFNPCVSRVFAAPAPNFITEIFFLVAAISHYGLNRTLQTYDDMHKEMEDIQRHIDFLNSSMSSLRPGVSRTGLYIGLALIHLCRIE